MKRVCLAKEVVHLLEKGEAIRGFEVTYLLSRVRFFLSGRFPDRLLTLSSKTIMVPVSLNRLHPLDQAGLIYHELTHVAQMLDLGWVRFMWRYNKQLFSVQYTYAKIVSTGFEKEAYSNQEAFLRKRVCESSSDSVELCHTLQDREGLVPTLVYPGSVRDTREWECCEDEGLLSQGLTRFQTLLLERPGY